MANRRCEDRPWKFLKVVAFQNAHVTAEGDLEQVREFTTPSGGILALRPIFPSEKTGKKNVTSNFEWSKLRDSSPPLSVIQTGIKHDGSPNAPPYDQGSLRWNQDQEEFARRAASKFQKGAREIKGTT